MGPRRVSLFVTCLVDLLYPEVGEATVALLRDLDVEVDWTEVAEIVERRPVAGVRLAQRRAWKNKATADLGGLPEVKVDAQVT